MHSNKTVLKPFQCLPNSFQTNLLITSRERKTHPSKKNSMLKVLTYSHSPCGKWIGKPFIITFYIEIEIKEAKQLFYLST